MHKVTYGSGPKTINVHMTLDDSGPASFDGCFALVFHGTLPRPFVQRDTRVFCSVKLDAYTNTVESIECAEGVRFSDLKRHIPTIFDTAHIRRINNKALYQKHKELALQLASSVIGVERAEELLARHNK
ncbi:hypothetical protein PAPHI01_2309 [Pancytospora philotis]|nr:hypothetical protein PAPHI01_2309 [Pancytospora philotis]